MGFCPDTIFVISSSQSCISQILRATSPLEEKFTFFSPLGFEIQKVLIRKPQN